MMDNIGEKFAGGKECVEAKTKEKIESLTPEQEAKLDVYRAKWIAIGSSTSPGLTDAEKKTVEELVVKAYAVEKLAPPKEFHWVKSPLAAVRLANKLEGKPNDNSIINNSCYGSHDAGWLSFYDYMDEVLELHEEVADMKPMIELAKLIGWWIPYENVVILSERPTVCKTNAEGDLHCDCGPAIMWGDDYKMFFLNGIDVPEQIATLPKEQITKEMFLEEGNADVKREIIKKIGIEQTIALIGAKTIDTYSTVTGGLYELLEVDYDGKGPRNYIKMKCPSSGANHILGTEGKTAKEALELLDDTKEEETERIWES
jgi:hypothetical protein